MVDIESPNRKVVIDMCCLCTFKEVIMLLYNILAMKSTDIFQLFSLIIKTMKNTHKNDLLTIYCQFFLI